VLLDAFNSTFTTASYLKVVHFHAGGCFFVKADVIVALGVMVTTGMFF
jgi:hypothetical protein